MKLLWAWKRKQVRDAVGINEKKTCASYDCSMLVRAYEEGECAQAKVLAFEFFPCLINLPCVLSAG